MSRINDLWHHRDRTRTPRYGLGARWQAVWTEAGHERKKAFRTKDAAEEHLTWVGHHQRTGTYVRPAAARVPVGELLDVWEATLVHLRPSARAAYRSDVRASIRPYWGDTILADIRRADVQAWVNHLSAGGKAARTVDTVHGRFRVFLNWCVSEGRISTNPARGVNLPTGNKREHIYLTVPQVRQLGEAVGGPYTDLVWFLATTGVRFGEAAELRGRDLHLSRGRVTVARSVTDAGGHMAIGPPKNTQTREVPLLPDVVERLRLRAHGRDQLIFPSVRGRQLRSNNFKRRVYDPAVKAAGLPGGLWVHDLRHTCASWAVQSGASVKSVQRMLGHATAAITLDVYAGLFDQDLDAVSVMMGALVQGLSEQSRPKTAQDP